MLDSSNWEKESYPLETEKALEVLESLAIDNPRLGLVLRRTKAFVELRQRGYRERVGYLISRDFSDGTCWKFAEYLKTGYLFFRVHGAEKELGQNIALAEAKERWGFPFMARFYEDRREPREKLVVQQRKIILSRARLWQIPMLEKLAPYVSDDPYERPSIPQELWDEVADQAGGEDVFNHIRRSLTRVVSSDVFAYMHAGVVVGENSEGYIMLDKSGKKPVRTVDFATSDYKQSSDLVLFESLDQLNSWEQSIVEAGMHESCCGKNSFDSYGRRTHYK